MATDRIECSRCGAAFESHDELMLHSVETHAGGPPGGMAPSNGTEPAGETGVGDGQVDPETAERILGLLEKRAAEDDTLLVRYGQRFLLLAGIGALLIAVVLSYLHVIGVLGTTVYMFSLGTLFGLVISYLQGFVQSTQR